MKMTTEGQVTKAFLFYGRRYIFTLNYWAGEETDRWACEYVTDLMGHESIRRPDVKNRQMTFWSAHISKEKIKKKKH